MKVCILGLGQVGLPTAKYALEKGLEVWGYDINALAVANARKQGILNATSAYMKIPRVDAYLICVTTSLKGNVPNLSAIFEVCKKISENPHDPSALICVESTVMPGTCKKIFEEIFHKQVHVAHVPHRYWVENSREHGVNQLRVIGAMNEKSLDKCYKLYKETLEIPLHKVWPIEVAEMCKIAENAYRYVQIAFAEELRMNCEEHGLNFNKVRDACNTKWNIDMPDARDGVGGTCLPKDTRYLASLTHTNRLLESAMSLNDVYMKWTANRINAAKQSRK
jgi:nucleotide sugar dehydrogenase